MAQQVEIAGVLFNNVPYIQCPDGNGVYHQFLDTTIASNAAAASDIAQGKLAYVNGSLVTGTASGGGGLVYETGTWTPASDITNTTISLSNTHTSAPFFYLISDETGTYSGTTNSNYSVAYYNFHQLFGALWYVDETSYRYGEARIFYKGTSAGTISGTQVYITTPYTSASDTTTSQSRYWATESRIRAYANSASRYWRAGRTYKWIAVWVPTS